MAFLAKSDSAVINGLSLSWFSKDKYFVRITSPAQQKVVGVAPVNLALISIFIH